MKNNGNDKLTRKKMDEAFPLLKKDLNSNKNFI